MEIQTENSIALNQEIAMVIIIIAFVLHYILVISSLTKTQPRNVESMSLRTSWNRRSDAIYASELTLDYKTTELGDLSQELTICRTTSRKIIQ